MTSHERTKPLTTADRCVLEGVQRDLSDLPDEDRVLSPTTILQVAARPPDLVEPRGEICGVRVDDPLDLSDAAVKRPLRFKKTTFKQTVTLERAQVPMVAFVDCKLPGGLRAAEIIVDGDLSVCLSTIDNGINIDGARIGGNLVCRGATITAPPPRPRGRPEECDALRAEGVAVGQVIYLDWHDDETSGKVAPFEATGRIFLVGAKVGGSLVCRYATLTNPNGYTLAADLAEITQGVFFSNNVVAKGAIRFGGAKLGIVHCTASKLSADSEARHPAFSLLHAEVPLGVTFNDEEDKGPKDQEKRRVIANGAIQLSGAHIGSTLTLEGVELRCGGLGDRRWSPRTPASTGRSCSSASTSTEASISSKRPFPLSKTTYT